MKFLKRVERYISAFFSLDRNKDLSEDTRTRPARLDPEARWHKTEAPEYWDNFVVVEIHRKWAQVQ